MPLYEPDPDNGTLPPGVHSREAAERALELTRTQVPASAAAQQASTQEEFLLAVTEPGTKGLRKKWTSREVGRMAKAEAWSFAWRQSRLDPGTISAVGNLLLNGMSVTSVRKALGITPHTWSTWIERGTGDELALQRPTTARPYTSSAGSAGIAGTGSTGTGSEGEGQESRAEDIEGGGYGGEGAIPQSPYNVLVYVVDNSQAIMELKAVKGWTSHFDRDWRSAQAYLIARNPGEWNPTTRTSVESTNHIKVDATVHRQADTAGLLEIAAILQAQGVMPTLNKAEVIGIRQTTTPDDNAKEGHQYTEVLGSSLPASTPEGADPYSGRTRDDQYAEMVEDPDEE